MRGFKKFVNSICKKFPHQEKEIKNFFNILNVPRGQLVSMMRYIGKLIDNKLITKLI